MNGTSSPGASWRWRCSSSNGGSSKPLKLEMTQESTVSRNSCCSLGRRNCSPSVASPKTTKGSTRQGSMASSRSPPANAIPWRIGWERGPAAAPPDGCGFRSREQTNGARCRFPRFTTGHSKPSSNSPSSLNGRRDSSPTAMDSVPDAPYTMPSVRSSSRLRSNPSTPWTLISRSASTASITTPSCASSRHPRP
jgi:hypothetical protein